jgi:hypothetical protein
LEECKTISEFNEADKNMVLDLHPAPLEHGAVDDGTSLGRDFS